MYVHSSPRCPFVQTRVPFYNRGTAHTKRMQEFPTHAGKKRGRKRKLWAAEGQILIEGCGSGGRGGRGFAFDILLTSHKTRDETGGGKRTIFLLHHQSVCLWENVGGRSEIWGQGCDGGK